jgi:hypothetical protein
LPDKKRQKYTFLMSRFCDGYIIAIFFEGCEKDQVRRHHTESLKGVEV